jgi:hypothetical protein
MADIGVALHAAVAAAYCQYASLRGIRGALISAIGHAVRSNRRCRSASRCAFNLRDALPAGLIRGFTRGDAATGV